MKFCEILRALIEDSDITQKKLAKDLNLGITTVGNYVRGLREPDFETLKLFADYFKVTTDYLLDFQCEDTKDHNEDELLKIYRSLSSEYKEIMKESGKVLLKHSK